MAKQPSEHPIKFAQPYSGTPATTSEGADDGPRISFIEALPATSVAALP
jgi:hypothetical protein